MLWYASYNTLPVDLSNQAEYLLQEAVTLSYERGAPPGVLIKGPLAVARAFIDIFRHASPSALASYRVWPVQESTSFTHESVCGKVPDAVVQALQCLPGGCEAAAAYNVVEAAPSSPPPLLTSGVGTLTTEPSSPVQGRTAQLTDLPPETPPKFVRAVFLTPIRPRTSVRDLNETEGADIRDAMHAGANSRTSSLPPRLPTPLPVGTAETSGEETVAKSAAEAETAENDEALVPNASADLLSAPRKSSSRLRSEGRTDTSPSTRHASSTVPKHTALKCPHYMVDDENSCERCRDRGETCFVAQVDPTETVGRCYSCNRDHKVCTIRMRNGPGKHPSSRRLLGSGAAQNTNLHASSQTALRAFRSSSPQSPQHNARSPSQTQKRRSPRNQGNRPPRGNARPRSRRTTCPSRRSTCAAGP